MKFSCPLQGIPILVSHPNGPQKTIPQHFAVFLFLGNIGDSSPVTDRLNTKLITKKHR